MTYRRPDSSTHRIKSTIATRGSLHVHTAARVVRTGRRTLLRVNASWPWTTQLATAFDRLSRLPRPIT